MKYEAYTEVRVIEDYYIFEFVSTGRHGDIIKRVTFTATETKKMYNLAFGDVDENDQIDDFTVTDNGDRDKVLATVAAIVQVYSKRFPDRYICFKGSTLARTRLYRMVIGRNLEELSSIYEIGAFHDTQWVPFVKNLKIDRFVIKRKRS